jgi:FkbM family methyltransferase
MTIRKLVKRWYYSSSPFAQGAFPYFGTRVYFPKNSWSFLAACDQGIFESDNVRLLQTLVRPNTWLFDVGANIGLMSIPVLQSITGSQVASFEPSPNVLEHLKKTIANSPYRDRWHLIPKVVGESKTRVTFNMAPPEMSLFDGIKATNRAPSAKQIELEMTTVDAEWEGLGKPDVSMIKIDVEGAELSALKGAVACIKQCKPYLLLEWNRVNLSAYGCPIDSLTDFAAEFGLFLYSVPTLVPITRSAELAIHMASTESFLLSAK